MCSAPNGRSNSQASDDEMPSPGRDVLRGCGLQKPHEDVTIHEHSKDRHSRGGGKSRDQAGFIEAIEKTLCTK